MAASHLSLRAPLLTSFGGNDESSVVGRLQPYNVAPRFLFRMFIACHILQLQTETRFTALVLVHRYARARRAATSGSIEDFENDGVGDWPWIGAACIFLACKAEEEPRRLRDVINMVHMVLSSPTPLSSSEDGNDVNDGSSRYSNVIRIAPQPPDLNEDYWKSKKRVIETEQAVLRWLGFDVFVSHPHRAVFLLLEFMPKNRDKLLSIAFRRLNDALFSSLALEHSVVELACAAIELAMDEVDRNAEVEGNGSIGGKNATTKYLNDRWWARYELTDESLSLCKDHLIAATSYVESSAETN